MSVVSDFVTTVASLAPVYFVLGLAKRPRKTRHRSAVIRGLRFDEIWERKDGLNGCPTIIWWDENICRFGRLD